MVVARLFCDHTNIPIINPHYTAMVSLLRGSVNESFMDAKPWTNQSSVPFISYPMPHTFSLVLAIVGVCVRLGVVWVLGLWRQPYRKWRNPNLQWSHFSSHFWPQFLVHFTTYRLFYPPRFHWDELWVTQYGKNAWFWVKFQHLYHKLGVSNSLSIPPLWHTTHTFLAHSILLICLCLPIFRHFSHRHRPKCHHSRTHWHFLPTLWYNLRNIEVKYIPILILNCSSTRILRVSSAILNP